MDSGTWQVALWGLAVFSVLGVFFGFALAAAALRFQVETHPLVDEARAVLPSANCGACGFAGCQAYAEAVVERPDVTPNLCAPGGRTVAQELARLTGKETGAVIEDNAPARVAEGVSRILSAPAGRWAANIESYVQTLGYRNLAAAFDELLAGR